MSSGGNLTEEQRKRIEENRRKALEKRATRIAGQSVQQRSTFSTSPSTDGRAICNKLSSVSQGVATPHSISLSSQNVPQKGSSRSADVWNANAYRRGSSGFQNNHPAKQGPFSVGNKNTVNGTADSHDSAPKFYSLGSKRPSDNPVKFQNTHREQSHANPQKLTSPSYKSSASNNTGPTSSWKACNTNSSKSATQQSSQGRAEKPVRGSCVLINRKRFTVDVPYQVQLIGIFKTMPSRIYGKSAERRVGRGGGGGRW